MIGEKSAKNGALAGLIAGIVFGAMMGMMGMLPMVGKLVGGSGAFAGFIVHIIFSVVIGVIFAHVLGHTVVTHGKGMIYGILYGVAWWVLGPLLIMPIWLGMGPQLSGAGISGAIPSLWGHLIYGFLLGLIYRVVTMKR